MKLFKLLTVTLVLTNASQSFGMLSRLSRLTRRLPAQRALVRAAIKPAKAVRAPLATAASQIKAVTTAPVASAQLRNFSNSAPVRVQASKQQEQESHDQQKAVPQFSRARIALGGLATLTGLGISLYDLPAKAEASQANDREQAIKIVQDKKNLEIKRIIEKHRIREELSFVVTKIDHDIANKVFKFINDNREAFAECLSFESGKKNEKQLEKCAALFMQTYLTVYGEDEFIKNYPGYEVGALQTMIGLDTRFLGENPVFEFAYVDQTSLRITVQRYRPIEMVAGAVDNVRSQSLYAGESRTYERYSIASARGEGRLVSHDKKYWDITNSSLSSTYFIESKNHMIDKLNIGLGGVIKKRKSSAAPESNL
jgi:hypothetical protein